MSIDQDEYDFDRNCFQVAAERGLTVVLPQDNQLQIDIDSEEQYQEFIHRFNAIDDEIDIEEKVSASGLPNRHIYLTFPKREEPFTDWERVCIQAALNDDPKRVFLNTLRILRGVENPSRLFEKPEKIEETKSPLEDEEIAW